MSKKSDWPGAETPGQQAGREMGNKRFYNVNNSINGSVMQEAKYPPGWLTRRVNLPRPENAASRAAVKFLQDLIGGVGRPAYRNYKQALGVPLDTPIHRLSRKQCWQLTNAIVADLEAQNAVNS